jgi:hypothetical protein
MTIKSHVLIDAGQSIVADGATIHGGPDRESKWSVRMYTCHGGRSEGVQVVEIDNGAMTIDVLPTRGMGIWRVRRGDRTLGWQAPARMPVHPAFVPLFDPSGLGWLEGFNELLCRCGLESNGGADFDKSGRLLYPLHGRIANLPAQHLELIADDEAGQLTLRGVVDETRFHFQSLRLTSTLTTILGSNEFSWTDEVENIGGREATMQMLYHFNIGQPLLKPGARIHAPIATVAPLTKVAADEGIDTWNIMPPPRPGSPEQVYLAELAANDEDNTQVLLTGLTSDEAVSLRFNKRTLPCFTLWRNTPTETDGYVVGLEPGTNYPNPRTFEKQQGRVVPLEPGKKWGSTVTVAWHTDRRSIDRASDSIRAIQGDRQPELLAQPRQGWTAGL